MNAIVDHILSAPTWLVYLLVGAIVFSEDAFFVGFVLPGETAAILGGVTASLGHTSVGWVLVVVILCAIVGDSVGYEIGRTFGTRILASKLFDKRRKKLDDARDFLQRRGGAAVFLGRWTAFFRAVMPALAGTARMPYPKFLMWNAAGGIAWGTTVVLIGYAAGTSYHQVAQWFGRGSAVVVVAVVVVAVVVWQVRKHRQERAEG